MSPWINIYLLSLPYFKISPEQDGFHHSKYMTVKGQLKHDEI